MMPCTFLWTPSDCALRSGKSTTIFHIVQSRLPAGSVALVTCVQNKAVDSLAEKLASTVLTCPFFVVGNEKNLGSTAAAYTLDRCWSSLCPCGSGFEQLSHQFLNLPC